MPNHLINPTRRNACRAGYQNVRLTRMKKHKIVVYGVLIMSCCLFSCDRNSHQASLDTEDGFVNIDLPVYKHETLPSGGFRFYARGSLEKTQIGFIIEISKDWKKTKIEDLGEEAYFYWGSGTFRSSGKDTDNFVSLLSSLYGNKRKKLKALQKIDADVVGLLDNPALVDTEPVKMKFFFNSDEDETFYSEVFINIDLSKKTIEFHEKDIDYRQALMRSLTEAPNILLQGTAQKPRRP